MSYLIDRYVFPAALYPICAAQHVFHSAPEFTNASVHNSRKCKTLNNDVHGKVEDIILAIYFSFFVLYDNVQSVGQIRRRHNEQTKLTRVFNWNIYIKIID